MKKKKSSCGEEGCKEEDWGVFNSKEKENKIKTEDAEMADNDWKVERGSWSTSEKVAGLWEPGWVEEIRTVESANTADGDNK